MSKAYYKILSLAAPRFDTVGLQGGNLLITWTGTGRLQQASALTGNQTDWSDVNPQPSGNTYTVKPQTGNRFYRLVNP